MTKLIKKVSEPKRLFYIGLGYSLFITLLFFLPAKEVPKMDIPISDKLVHVVIFCILSFLWLCFFLVKNKNSVKSIVTISVAIFGYGIIIEVLQELFFETRSADIWDVVANTLGIFIGWLSYYLFPKKYLYEQN